MCVISIGNAQNITNAEIEWARGIIHKNKKELYSDAIRVFNKYPTNAFAQNGLAAMYYRGLGVKQSYPKAFVLFRKAAAQRNINALYNLGEMYYYGRGVTQSYEKAFQYWNESCKMGK